MLGTMLLLGGLPVSTSRLKNAGQADFLLGFAEATSHLYNTY